MCEEAILTYLTVLCHYCPGWFEEKMENLRVVSLRLEFAWIPHKCKCDGSGAYFMILATMVMLFVYFLHLLNASIEIVF
jgi:hypothetical protein